MGLTFGIEGGADQPRHPEHARQQHGQHQKQHTGADRGEHRHGFIRTGGGLRLQRCQTLAPALRCQTAEPNDRGATIAEAAACFLPSTAGHQPRPRPWLGRGRAGCGRRQPRAVGSCASGNGGGCVRRPCVNPGGRRSNFAGQFVLEQVGLGWGWVNTWTVGAQLIQNARYPGNAGGTARGFSGHGLSLLRPRAEYAQAWRSGRLWGGPSDCRNWRDGWVDWGNRRARINFSAGPDLGQPRKCLRQFMRKQALVGKSGQAPACLFFAHGPRRQAARPGTKAKRLHASCMARCGTGVALSSAHATAHLGRPLRRRAPTNPRTRSC